MAGSNWQGGRSCWTRPFWARPISPFSFDAGLARGRKNIDPFDFIIVGAGSAGCVLASRLSENPKFRVLLIESGPPDTHPMIHMPKGFGALLGDREHVWQLPYVLRAGGVEKSEDWIVGRTLGGSNSVNGLQYNRGQPQDYDLLEEQGNKGWGWRHIGAVFKKMEDHELGEAEFRGIGGPVHIQVNPGRLPLHEAFLAAGVQQGLQRLEDVNEPNAVGLGYAAWNIRDGRRCGAAQAFLAGSKRRPNLQILSGTDAQRISFEGTRAVGVSCRQKGQAIEFRAARDIVICAGVMLSPALLERSGVGAAERLKALGIDVVSDSPGVGENLRDQRYLCLRYRLRANHHSTNRDYASARLVKSVLEYVLFHRGVMAWAGAEIAGSFKSRPELDWADAHLVTQSFTFESSPQGAARKLERAPGLSVMVTQSRPESRGSVKIVSSDPGRLPEIRLNHFAHELDRKTAPLLLNYVRELCGRPALSGFIANELSPGAAVQSEGEVIDEIMEHGHAGMHAVGTCRMGRDRSAVVDEKLRVHGTSNLRVADCSILPSCISGNGGTSAPAMAIGWRAADFMIDEAA